MDKTPVLEKITEAIEDFKQHPTTNIEYLYNERLIATSEKSVHMHQNNGNFQALKNDRHGSNFKDRFAELPTVI